MTITDPKLLDAMRSLSDADRALIGEHMRGKSSVESWALIRQLRKRLKRKARARLPRKLIWLD